MVGIARTALLAPAIATLALSRALAADIAADPEAAADAPHPVGAPMVIPALFVRAPKEEPASFAGMPRQGRVMGAPYAMMYAGGLPGLLVGVAAHGVIESVKQSRQRSANGALSDLALEPYRATLQNLTNSELLRRALGGLETHGDKALIAFTDQPGPGWLIECTPQFLMTDDQRALVVLNTIMVRGPTAGAPPIFKNVVEVVGEPRASVGRDEDNAWMQDGEQLVTASAAILRESMSLALALDGALPAGAPVSRTVHYVLGGGDATERAQVLRESPRRLVLKNLHGWIMSVPIEANPEPPAMVQGR